MDDRVYTIKPLEWKHGATADGSWASAGTILGTLSVWADADSCRWQYCVSEYYDEGQEECESIADGVAKAEAWYLKRLGRAIDPIISTSSDRLRRELLDTAAWLEERAGCAEAIAQAGKRLSRVGLPATAEAARLRGRAVLLRQAANRGG